MTEMIGHVAETAGHDEPTTESVTMGRNPRSRYRNQRSRWSEIPKQDAAVLQLSTTNEKSQAKVDGLLTANQQLELELATARSSVTAHEHVVVSLLERFSATAPDPELARNPEEVARQSVKRESKKSTGTGT